MPLNRRRRGRPRRPRRASRDREPPRADERTDAERSFEPVGRILRRLGLGILQPSAEPRAIPAKRAA